MSASLYAKALAEQRKQERKVKREQRPAGMGKNSNYGKAVRTERDRKREELRKR